MEYKLLSKKKLREFNKIKSSIFNLEERIKLLKEILNALKKDENKLNINKNNIKNEKHSTVISEIEDLTQILTYRKYEVRRIERAIRALPKEHQLILDKFYINYETNYLNFLMSELGYERRSIYYHRDKALKDFTLAMYGIIDA